MSRTPDRRRIKSLTITGELLMQFLKRGIPACQLVGDPLPDDATITGAAIDGRGDLKLTIASGEYPVWDPLTKLPEIKPPSYKAAR